MYNNGSIEIKREDDYIHITRLSDGVGGKVKVSSYIFGAFYTAIGGNDEYGSGGWGFNFDAYIYSDEHFSVFKPFKKLGWIENYKIYDDVYNHEEEHTRISISALAYLPMIFYEACCAVREGTKIEWEYYAYDDAGYEDHIKFLKDSHEIDVQNSNKAFPEFMLDIFQRYYDNWVENDAPEYETFISYKIEDGLLMEVLPHTFEREPYVFPLFSNVVERINEIYTTITQEDDLPENIGQYKEEIDESNAIDAVLGLEPNEFWKIDICRLIGTILLLNMMASENETKVETVTLEQLSKVNLPSNLDIWDFISLKQIEDDEIINLKIKEANLMKQEQNIRSKLKEVRTDIGVKLNI